MANKDLYNSLKLRSGINTIIYLLSVHNRLLTS